MTDTSTSRRAVVIGAGPAAHRLATALRARDAAGRVRLTVIGEEDHLPYDRVALSKRFIGGADLTLDPAIWDDPATTLIRGERAIALDRAASLSVPISPAAFFQRGGGTSVTGMRMDASTPMTLPAA